MTKTNFNYFATAIIAVALYLLFTQRAIASDYSHYKDECESIRQTVESILDSNNVSKKYFYLLVAESHCRNDKVSSAGAVGYWQMMPYTARKFGCEDPYDLVCETNAAAKYLKHLEQKCHADHVIYCWHDGGTNFIRNNKVPSKGAVGLKRQYLIFMKDDSN